MTSLTNSLKQMLSPHNLAAGCGDALLNCATAMTMVWSYMTIYGHNMQMQM